MFRLFDEKVSEKHPVFQAAKVAEETGEAINLVFKLAGFRRESYDMEEVRRRLSDELADVVITAQVELMSFNQILQKIINGECFDAALVIATLIVLKRRKF